MGGEVARESAAGKTRIGDMVSRGGGERDCEPRSRWAVAVPPAGSADTRMLSSGRAMFDRQVPGPLSSLGEALSS